MKENHGNMKSYRTNEIIHKKAKHMPKHLTSNIYVFFPNVCFKYTSSDSHCYLHTLLVRHSNMQYNVLLYSEPVKCRFKNP